MGVFLSWREWGGGGVEAEALWRDEESTMLTCTNHILHLHISEESTML